eukprot:ANDGO_00447.mRNA.1 Eukaryotic translation initiation factor 4E
MTEDFSSKHRLENRWTFFFEEPSFSTNADSWESNAQPIHHADTVEDFWAVFDNIPAPSKLNTGSTYYLMKNDVTPTWEHPMNKVGGRWVYQLEKRSTDDSDKVWLDACLACIGESFSHGEAVCGCVAQVRAKGNRIALWVSSAESEDIVMALGQEFKNALELTSAQKIAFSMHDTGAVVPASTPGKTPSGMSKSRKNRRDEMFSL